MLPCYSPLSGHLELFRPSWYLFSVNIQIDNGRLTINGNNYLIFTVLDITNALLSKNRRGQHHNAYKDKVWP